MDENLIQKLDAEIAAACARAESAPFVWGSDDCLLWLADIYRAALGVDPAAAYRGRYASLPEAEQLLGKRGIVGALERVAREHGWQRHRAGCCAGTGDLGLMQTLGGPAGVICRGDFFLGRIEQGWCAWPVARARRAWRVA